MKRRALFLDRDGVVNVDYKYVISQDEFQFIPGIFELCRAAQGAGYMLVVITNQAGIAHGYYSEQDLALLHDWMRGRFAAKGITVDAIYYCPFHPAAAVKRFQADSFDRKPKPGMLLRASEDMNIDLADSVLIGDCDTDIVAGVRAGVGKLFKFDPALPPDVAPVRPGFVSGSLRAIADFLWPNIDTALQSDTRFHSGS